MKETTTGEKILNILNMPSRKELIPSVEALLEKYGDKVERVACKVASKSGSPDARWLSFTKWCESERDAEKPKKKAKVKFLNPIEDGK